MRLFVEIARAVAHVYACVMVHRDLEPSNITVAEADRMRHVTILHLGDAGRRATAENLVADARRVGRARCRRRPFSGR